jgi:putative endopeptidase
MPTLFRTVAAVLVTLVVSSSGQVSGQNALPVAAPPDYGPWGFNLSGADFATKSGDDFFRYANGAWFDRTAIPPDRTSAGPATDLEDVVESRIRDILARGAEGVGADARADAAKFGVFYANFLNEARADALDTQPIASMLDAIRATQTRDDVAALMGSANLTFFSSIFTLTIPVDAKAPGQYTVSLSQSGLGLPNRDYYLTPSFAAKKEAYRAYIAQILQLIGWDAPERSADAIVAFETAIAQASWPLSDTRDSTKTYNPTSVADLSRTIPFPWERFLDSAKLGDLDRIVLSEVTAIPKIAAAFNTAPLDTLKAWQAFHVADAAAPYLSKRFVTASFEFRSRTLSGVAELPERWKRGVRLVNDAMSDAVGRVYAARYFPPESKAQIETMVGQLRAALKGRIERLTWMSPQTKDKAIEKLARINSKLAYPSKWRDYSSLDIRADDLIGNIVRSRVFEWLRIVNRRKGPVDRDDWDIPPQTVNAYYDSTLNEIVMPAAILQPPYFDPAADAAVNFGGIGAIIGHELTHGFDDDGRRYDGSGMLTDWWTEEDAREFEARAARLGKQYDAFEPFPGIHVNGDLTMGENIADLGGVLVALDAYRLSLAGGAAPVKDGFSGEQRFFLGYAQSWRAKRTEDSERQQLVSDPHAPEQYRVNGVVRNVDAWYAAFGVKLGDKLFVADGDRVRIW